MAGLKEIRNRISSIASTMQITSAMKMVSAAKQKKASDALASLVPYFEKTKEIISSVAIGMENLENVYAQKRVVKSILLIAITSNRGLCGAFNSNVIKQIEKLMGEYGSDYNISIAAIGKKGYSMLKKNHSIFYTNNTIYDNLTMENSDIVAKKIMDDFSNEKFDRVLIVYSHAKNIATQVVTTEQFLPISTKKRNLSSSVRKNDYIFEPSKAEVIRMLMPKALKIEFYKILRDSLAAEHGARMTAMHKATDNAQELKDELTLKYNKERQGVITGEILEIVGGAEALNA